MSVEFADYSQCWIGFVKRLHFLPVDGALRPSDPCTFNESNVCSHHAPNNNDSHSTSLFSTNNQTIISPHNHSISFADLYTLYCSLGFAYCLANPITLGESHRVSIRTSNRDSIIITY